MRWLVDALAVYRLTRLVAADGITEPIRDVISEWTESGPQTLVKEKVAELIECRWCVGMWVALGLVYVVRRRSWWPNMADALAFSALAALIAGLEDE